MRDSITISNRRYADRSFCDMVAQMPPERSIGLYGQVLLKIESYYVDVPRWKDIVDCGARGFVLALGEPTFVDRNIPQRSRLAIDAFRQELSSSIGSAAVRNRDDAVEFVTAAARLAQQTA